LWFSLGCGSFVTLVFSSTWYCNWDRWLNEANASGSMIEVPMESAAEGLDARRIPAGEIGQGAIVDFAVVGLAKENAGARVAIGDGGDVHADQIQQLLVYMKNNLSFT
jgi:hypothetical protein